MPRRSKSSPAPRKRIPKTTRPATRVGKRLVGIFVAPETWQQLKQLSLETETTAQDLGLEALNLLFEKHQLKQIA